MWQLIKADFLYNKFIIFISYLMAIPFLVLVWQWPATTHEKSLFILVSMFVLAVLVIIIKNSILIQEKRTRFFAELPISPWKAGVSRLVFIFIFWGGLLALFWLSKWILQPWKSTGDTAIIWGMLNATGIILILNGLYLMFEDLKYCFESGTKRLSHKKKQIYISQLFACGIVTDMIILLVFVLIDFLFLRSGKMGSINMGNIYPKGGILLFLGSFLILFALGALIMLIHRLLVPAFGEGIKNIIITSVSFWLAFVLLAMISQFSTLSLKTLIENIYVLPGIFFGTFAGARMYRKGHRGLVPRMLVMVGILFSVLFIWKIFSLIYFEPNYPFFSRTLYKPEITLNVAGLVISFLGVLTYRDRRTYVK